MKSPAPICGERVRSSRHLPGRRCGGPARPRRRGLQIADEGRTYTFKLEDAIAFHSGNPLTAADAAWSLQRVIQLQKTPSFILGQFGFTPDNVDERIPVVDERTFTVELDKPYAPTFFLYCLTATVGSVTDRKLASSTSRTATWGTRLRTASAGSGPFHCAPGSGTVADRRQQSRVLGRGAGLGARP